MEARHPNPEIPLFTSGKPDLVENVDRLLDGLCEV
jgi:hypothetical protein